MRGVVDTLVVGAGLSGLAYAHARGPGADLLVLEATERPGGLVRTTRAQLESGGALQFEWGPELLPAAPELGTLLAELKLEARPTPPAAARQLVLHGGRLHPLPAGPLALLSSGLLSWRGKLRALTEPLRPDRSSLAGSSLDGSVAEFVRQRLGDEVLQRLADPLVTALYATEPERLSLRATFPELPRMVTEHGSLWGGRRAQQRGAPHGAPRVAPRGAAGVTLQGGIAKLTETLARSLGNRLLVNARITSITQEPATFDDPWEAVSDLTRHPMVWRVDGQSPKASITEDLCWRARRLVLALPPRAASRMLLPVDRTLAERLASISSESVVSLSHAWRRQDVGHKLDAAGFLVPSSESRVQLGTLFSSTIRPGCSTEGVVLLRTLLGGGRNPRVVDWPEEELWGVIMQEVAPVLGLKGQPLWRSVIRQREALPRYDLEHPARREHIGHMLAALPGLSLLGAWNRGHGCEQLVSDARALARDHAALEAKEVRIAPALRVRSP